MYYLQLIKMFNSNGYTICKDLGSSPTYVQRSFSSVTRFLHSTIESQRVMCPKYLARGYQRLHVKQANKQTKKNMAPCEIFKNYKNYRIGRPFPPYITWWKCLSRLRH